MSELARTRGLSCRPPVRLKVGDQTEPSHLTSPSLPGADDDGSGSMSILEAYRALIAAGFHPERAVEFHWYSAEVRPSSVAQKLNLQEDVP